MKTLKTAHGTIKCKTFQEGVPVDPVLPKMFHCTPNDERPASHQKFWFVPFITTESMPSFPDGIRYTVQCLNGGAWDRPTFLGIFSNLEDAVKCAMNESNEK